MAYIYELKDIKHIYTGRLVLDIHHLRIDEKSIIGVFGPNGSGKSTLLRLLAFLEEPSGGTLSFQGKRVLGSDIHLRRQVSLLDQNPYLLKRSVKGNIAYGLKLRGITNREDKVRAVMQQVGLDMDSHGRRPWRQLSGGEAQRVALASRLALKPKVLLMDEPTSNLDANSTELIRKASLDARQRWGAVVILVSHDQKWLESVSDTCIFLQEGKMAAL